MLPNKGVVLFGHVHVGEGVRGRIGVDRVIGAEKRFASHAISKDIGPGFLVDLKDCGGPVASAIGICRFIKVCMILFLRIAFFGLFHGGAGGQQQSDGAASQQGPTHLRRPEGSRRRRLLRDRACSSTRAPFR